MLPTEGLARFDFFRNFPHLGLFGARSRTRLVRNWHEGRSQLRRPYIESTSNCLPTATCHGLLLSLRKRGIKTSEVTTSIGRCFRNEEHYDGLRRLRAFHMREVRCR